MGEIHLLTDLEAALALVVVLLKMAAVPLMSVLAVVAVVFFPAPVALAQVVLMVSMEKMAMLVALLEAQAHRGQLTPQEDMGAADGGHLVVVATMLGVQEGVLLPLYPHTRYPIAAQYMEAHDGTYLCISRIYL